jgi:hypothetical protein
LDDEDVLPGVTAGVRVFQDVEQVAALDVEDDPFEPDALRPELRVLRHLREISGRRRLETGLRNNRRHSR